MKIEQINPAELAPADYNPRQIEEHQAAALRRSLDRWGFVEPIVANKRTGLVVGGHQRLDAALALALPTVPVHWVDLDDSAEKALNIALNKISGAWDEDKLAALLADLEGDGQDLADLGFASEELDELLADYNDAPGIEGDLDEVPEPPAEPITQPGDLWQLGEHRLLCGDSTNAEDVARLMGGEKAGVLLTDPPYGIGIAANPVRQKHPKSDWDNKAADPSVLIDSYAQAIIWGGNYFKLPPAKGFFVWDKKQPEDFTLAMVEMAWTNIDIPAKMHRKSVTSYAKDHPTQKPVCLMAWCLSYTDGDVFDPFAGSGTTIIAAEQTGRKCYAMEISPAYCDVAVARWEAATGLKAELVR